MKPSVQKILTKLTKDKELEKVELSLINNLIKEYGRLQTLGLEMEILDISNKLEKRIPDYSKLKNKFEDVAEKAKELGVDKMFNEAKEFSKACTDKIKRIKKQSTTIKSITKR